MARTWLTSDPFGRPVKDVAENLLPAEVDIESMEHFRVFDDRLIGRRERAKDLPAAPFVDEMVDPGDEEDHRALDPVGQPPGPGLDRQEPSHELDAGGAELV